MSINLQQSLYWFSGNQTLQAYIALRHVHYVILEIGVYLYREIGSAITILTIDLNW